MRNNVFKIVCWSALVLLGSCVKDDDNISNEVKFYIPNNFPQPVYTFANNEITQSGFELGRKLFYDPILSRDSSISCGNCHQQNVAFANADHRLSHGVDGLNGTRNSPALFNLAWYPSFFWDGGVTNIEVQAAAPIVNPIEMDETIANCVLKLSRSKTYPQLFKKAFATDSITSKEMLLALTQFMTALISADSKYDQYVAGKVQLTSNEKSGLDLFRQKCESCHKEPLFSDRSYRNNGLDFSFGKDAGRAHITSLASDSGKFTVPSLRNVALTYPYMHDGRMKDLTAVMNHYSNGVKPSSTLDSLLQGGIPLSNQEKLDIISFLNTLTDNTFINDRRFSEVQ
jgi:cytochrome c peroxidase